MHCPNGVAKISLHAMLSLLLLQADALAKVQADRLGELRGVHEEGGVRGSDGLPGKANRTPGQVLSSPRLRQ